MDAEQTWNLSALVGRNIAERRKVLALTQEEVAERLKITAAALSRIESGRTAPKFERLKDIATVLGCRVADLFYEEVPKPADALAGIAEMMKPLPLEAQSDLVRMFAELVRVFRKNSPTNQVR